MNRLAVPSQSPGGLEAQVDPHFGHCAVFTLVNLEDGQVKGVELLPNEEHTAGGCLAPVNKLKAAGVEALVAGGMGPRPLAGFQEAGIDVYFNQVASTVAQAVQMVTNNQAPKFGPAQVCGHGDGGCGHH